ncbi:putative bifunctional diguanylate cyclase/phosphodiesterase [Geopsychrobacter electrodiphilus]|uniref:putative bifunctional diguanylate cyclase/phosphodiesterase n=1 Tax=Geopsychrobacter electrodiphilus TaxID=225196 RepID=UPI00035D4028|nr:EAL domain-containing protein [Geopsychrobacter electrodiphilus]
MSEHRSLCEKILVVDDELAMRKSLSLLLSGAGFEALAAADGAEALSLCETAEYPVMLLDLQMPGTNGHQVLTGLLQQKAGTRVVVLSGETSFDAVRDSLQLGAYDFVRKPYPAEELLTTIRNALASYHQEQERVRLKKTMLESEKLHRYIVNNSPDFVYVLDKNGHFTFVNDTAEGLLGYTRDELLGRHYSDLVFEEDLPLARYVFNERRTGERSTRNVELRLKVNTEQRETRTFDTHLLPIELSSVGMYNAGYTGDPNKFIGTYGCARDMTERKRAAELIHFHAYHDQLTSLPNRALFEDRLGLAIAHSKRNEKMLAVIFLDLDRFKLINDTLGHSLGDQVLQGVAERIQGCLRAEDTLSRFGGDEFTLLLPQLEDQRDAATVAKKILMRICEPYLIGEHEMFLSASIGIALFPDAGETGDSLLRAADVAMYHIKGEGKNGFAFFQESMTAGWGEHLSLERDLHRAIEDEQFSVFFQPKVNSSSSQIVGLEALIRWRHPIRGLIYPDQFIPLAETSKQIIQIDNWVLRTTCAEIRRWREQGLPPVPVSVNISVVQIEQPNFVQGILSTLAEFGIPGHLIEIEVTESGIMKNRETTALKLRALSQHGISIAVDDFGTGYSSLSYLHQFPVDTLKIDKSFVQQIKEGTSDACIVDAIVAMGRGLRLHIIAEGVETEAQLSYLQKIGCSEVQGFLFGGAQSAQQTFELLRSGVMAKAPACPLEDLNIQRFQLTTSS